MDWDKVRIFHAVAQAGSFTHAGTALGLSQSAVSRQVSSLEASLGVPLFHRHARGLLLTEQGEHLHAATLEVFGRLSLAETTLRNMKENAQGQLKVTATTALGTMWLTPRIREFLERYPEVQVELLLDDRGLDLAMREADVAIRLREPTQLDLIRRRVFDLRFHLYASKSYLARRGTPETVSDLDVHDLVAYVEPPTKFDLGLDWVTSIGRNDGKKRTPRLRTNSFLSILAAIEAGVGIGPLPDYVVGGRPSLTRVLPEVHGPVFDIFLVYPEELRSSKRVGVFRDFLIEQARDWRHS